MRLFSVSPSSVQFVLPVDADLIIGSSELGVTIALDCEIILRFMSDWRHFFKHRRNMADLFLAIATTIIQIPVIKNSGQPYAWLTIFQILRIYRLVLALEMTRTLIVGVLVRPPLFSSTDASHR